MNTPIFYPTSVPSSTKCYAERAQELAKLIKGLDLKAFRFIRHSKTLNNINRCVQGAAAIHVPIAAASINENEIKLASKDLYNDVLSYHKVFCSPALRAIQSAAILGEYDAITIVEPLNEIDWGDIDLEKMGEEYEAINKKWFEDRELHEHIMNGESMDVFIHRALDSLHQVIRLMNEGGAYMIVGHGLWSCVIFSLLMGDELPQLKHKPSHMKVINILETQLVKNS